MPKYNKLVRDRIPEIIEGNGEEPITRILNDEEYRSELIKKLNEEYDEVVNASGEDIIEELADMLEVMESIAKLQNKTLDNIIIEKEKKKNKRGGFSKKIFLEGVKK
ncbi:MAG: nucleoside triphosphate pyrophosphohydrolase [Tenericutes bacterium]|nr:nucleoside triphosphate pyrophosphohydrolase [Mycoplasmatota bacterium]